MRYYPVWTLDAHWIESSCFGAPDNKFNRIEIRQCSRLKSLTQTLAVCCPASDIPVQSGIIGIGGNRRLNGGESVTARVGRRRRIIECERLKSRRSIDVNLADVL